MVKDYKSIKGLVLAGRNIGINEKNVRFFCLKVYL